MEADAAFGENELFAALLAKERCFAGERGRAARTARGEGRGFGLGVGRAAEGEVTRLPSVHAGFAADIFDCLLPDQIGERTGNTRLVDEGVGRR